MKKILAYILAITMAFTTMSACIIPASAQETVAELINENPEIFNEDFEKFNVDGTNWIAGLDENDYVTGITNMDENSWTIYGSNHNLAGASGVVEVVNWPEGSTNKALKLSTGNMASKNWYRIRINANGNNGLNRQADLNGKKLVLKADFYVPTGTDFGGDPSVFGYDPNQKTMSTYFRGVGSTFYDARWYINCVGGARFGQNVFGRTLAKMTPEKTEIKYIYDLTEYQTDNHPADTLRAFANDTIYTFDLGNEGNTVGSIGVNAKYPQPSQDATVGGGKVIDGWGAYNDFGAVTENNNNKLNFGDFYGASLTIVSAGKADNAIYMDNVRAYYVDAFKQEGAISYGKVDEEGRWYSGAIKIPFNNPIRESVTDSYATFGKGTKVTTYSLKQLVHLVDVESGETVEGGVKEAYAQDNVLCIVPEYAALTQGKEYKLIADALFMDVGGQGLNQYSKEEYLTSFSVGVDPYAHIIYSESFDNYAKDKEWLPDSNGYVTAEGVEEGTWSVAYGTSYDKSGSVMVVTDVKDANNQVLAITPGTSPNASYKGYFNIRRNATTNGTAISRTSSAMSIGKKLVYEVKVRVPSGFSGEEAAFLSNSTQKVVGGFNQFAGAYNSLSGNNGLHIRTAGTYYYPQARSTAAINDGQWHTMRIINDVSKPLSETHSDTSRAYVDDVLYTGYYNTWEAHASDPAEELADASLYDKNVHGSRWFVQNATYPVIMENDTTRTPVKQIDYLPSGVFQKNTYLSMGDFWGTQFTALNKASNPDTTNNTYYIDDLSAYWIDALTVTAPNASNFVGGAIKLNFNQQIREEVKEREGRATTYNTHNLADLITITDLNGNAVQDAVASVKLSADGKTVSLAPGTGLLANSEYKIVISPLLVDIYGQGLKNNSTATIINLKVGEFQPFKLTSISQTSFSGFATGRDAKVTAQFTVDIDEEIIVNGVTVTNKDTGATVAFDQGWTASFGTDEEGNIDYKKVIFDFSQLETANYEVMSNELFTLDGVALLNPFTITLTKINQPIVLFNETFESGYTVGDNWIKDANKDTDLTGSTYNYTVNNHQWDIQIEGRGNDTKNAVVKVVDINDVSGVTFGENFSGNALYISNPDATAYNKGILSIRRNFDKLNGISLTGGEYKGKVLVVEADIIAPEKTPWESPFLSPATDKNKVDEYLVSQSFSNMFLRNGNYRISQGSYAESSYGPVYMWHPTKTVATAGNANIRVVLDQSNGTVDSMRIYINGNVSSTKIENVFDGHKYAGATLSDFSGKNFNGGKWKLADLLYGIWTNVGKSPYYIDNFKAYLEDPFEIESVTGASEVYNQVEGQIVYTFSKAVDESSLEGNIVLLNNEGNVVANGIKKYELSDGGYKLTVKLSENILTSTNYTLKLKDNLRSTDGLAIAREYSLYEYPIDEFYTANSDGTYDITYAGKVWKCTLAKDKDGRRYLHYDRNGTGTNNAVCYIDAYFEDADLMKTEVKIKTAKSISLYAEATEAEISGNTISTAIKFTNPALEAKDVWCVVAAYGEYEEMLGCSTPIIKTLEASEKTEAETVTINVNNINEVKAVKLFVLNNFSDMAPYHKVESLLAQ